MDFCDARRLFFKAHKRPSDCYEYDFISDTNEKPTSLKFLIFLTKETIKSKQNLEGPFNSEKYFSRVFYINSEHWMLPKKASRSTLYFNTSVL